MTTVSLIATVRNEAHTVAPWLRSILTQDRPPDEVVLVDGGSDDGTPAVIGSLADEHPQIRLEVAPGLGIAAGRNLAIALSRGDIIAVTDAGTRLSAGWLAELAGTLEADPALSVASGFFLPGGDTWFERTLSSIITPHLSEIDPAAFLPSSRSVAFRRDAWERVRGYPEWLEHCEDLVFDLDLRRTGARFSFVPSATVSWSARPSLRAFARQYYMYARGDAHAGLWLRRHLVRYAAYAAGVVLLASTRTSARALLACGALLHTQGFVKRLHRHQPFDAPADMLVATVLVPVVVITGDLAKMLGYACGQRERRRRTADASRRP